MKMIPSVESKKRIKWLDFAKGSMIFLVVFIHVADNLNLSYMASLLKNTALIIVMPIFFAISGFLYKPSKSIHSYFIMLYKKATSFIIPFYVFTIISLLIHMNNGSAFYHFLYLPLNYLWFLYVLFFVFIIYGLLDLIKCPELLKFLLSFFLMCASPLLLNHIVVTNSFSAAIYNSIAGISGYMMIFYLGYLIKKYNCIKYLKRYPRSLVLSFLLIAIVYFFIKGTGPNTDFMTKSDIFLKIFSVPVFFSVFCNIPHNYFFKYFTKYGRSTLMIYLLQSPVIILVNSLFLFYSHKFVYNYPVLILCISLLLDWYLCILICKIINSNSFLYSLFYPRYYINKLICKTDIGYKFLHD